MEPLDGVAIEADEWKKMSAICQNGVLNVTEKRKRLFNFVGRFLLVLTIVVIGIFSVFIEEQVKAQREQINDLYAKVIENKPYQPFGPQNGVNLSTITSGGWTNCWTSGYETTNSVSLSIILGKFCTAPYLLMA